MPNPIVTKDAVFAAAVSLKADGISVTLARVQNLTGGSNSTVGPWLREWRQNEVSGAREGEPPPPPERLRTAIEQMTQAFWRAMEAEAAEKLSTTLAIAEQKVQASKSDYDDAIAQLQIAERALEDAEQKLDMLQKDRDELRLLSAKLEATSKQFEKELKEEKAARRAAEATASETLGQLKEIRAHASGKSTAGSK